MCPLSGSPCRARHSIDVNSQPNYVTSLVRLLTAAEDECSHLYPEYDVTTLLMLLCDTSFCSAVEMAVLHLSSC